VLGRNGICCAVQKVGMMVAVGSRQHLGRRAGKARRLPHRYAALHDPSCCSMAQRPWRYLARPCRRGHRIRLTTSAGAKAAVRTNDTGEKCPTGVITGRASLRYGVRPSCAGCRSQPSNPTRAAAAIVPIQTCRSRLLFCSSSCRSHWFCRMGNRTEG
jgi:hypothetical protein